MLRSRWIQALRSLGLEFWLPLPLLGLIFWVVGGLLTEQMLNHSSYRASKLQVDTQQLKEPSTKVLSIQVGIYRDQGYSRVKVNTANSALQELEFKFLVTQKSQVEAAISQELGLSTEQVSKLMCEQILIAHSNQAEAREARACRN